MIRTVLEIQGDVPGAYQDRLDYVLSSLGYVRRGSEEQEINYMRQIVSLEKRCAELESKLMRANRDND